MLLYNVIKYIITLLLKNKMDNNKYYQPNWDSPEYIESLRILCAHERILNSIDAANHDTLFRKRFIPDHSKGNYLYNYPIANKCSNHKY